MWIRCSHCGTSSRPAPRDYPAYGRNIKLQAAPSLLKDRVGRSSSAPSLVTTVAHRGSALYSLSNLTGSTPTSPIHYEVPTRRRRSRRVRDPRRRPDAIRLAARRELDALSRDLARRQDHRLHLQRRHLQSLDRPAAPRPRSRRTPRTTSCPFGVTTASTSLSRRTDTATTTFTSSAPTAARPNAHVPLGE